MDIGQYEGKMFLVMVDWTTRYIQVEWLKSKQPKEIIKALLNKWISYFGPPNAIMTDCGREFQNEGMISFGERMGIEIKSTASESSWSNGKAEKIVELLKTASKIKGRRRYIRRHLSILDDKRYQYERDE